MYDSLYTKKQNIEKAIEELQNTCQHEALLYKADGCTGGWDYEGSAWYDFHCFDCNKRWRTDQNTQPPENAIKVKEIKANWSYEYVEALIKLNNTDEIIEMINEV